MNAALVVGAGAVLVVNVPLLAALLEIVTEAVVAGADEEAAVVGAAVVGAALVEGTTLVLVEVSTTVEDVVETSALVVGATEDGATEEEAVVGPAALTEEHAALAALRTLIAWLPQELRTQLVAALWIAASLAAVHWQARSSAPQVVAEATAFAIQSVAHAGMVVDWAAAKLERARTATVVNEYFILTTGGPC